MIKERSLNWVKISNNLIAALARIRWGGHCLISLYISLISGMVIALQYNPSLPFYSTITFELAAPFGTFWRALHFYSSQACFLFLIFHFIVVIIKNQHSLTRSSWIRLSLSLPVGLLLLFTGYILRGDATGTSAGAIAEHITLSFPFLGNTLNDLLFAGSKSGVLRIYANHLITLVLIGLFCIWPHIKQYSARWTDHLMLILCILCISVFIIAPMEPEHFGLLRISGPWFFIGLQELLRHLPVFWAGIFFPAILMGAMLFFPLTQKYRKTYIALLSIWVSIYLVLSFTDPWLKQVIAASH
ncbi:MAG: cytochrome b N-terminal domain-containing protein [Desulfobulbaceae bacterium]|nr:cytochrome b N-terminal domain-containing protein [Desulfobulbaceae bacterium]